MGKSFRVTMISTVFFLNKGNIFVENFSMNELKGGRAVSGR